MKENFKHGRINTAVGVIRLLPTECELIDLILNFKTGRVQVSSFKTMSRIGITNRNGEWFDTAKATLIKEYVYHNGRNFISRATDSQFEHEWLYITASNKYVLHCYSNYQGVPSTYEIIESEEAAKWFSKQGFSKEDIPQELLSDVNKFEI